MQLFVTEAGNCNLVCDNLYSHTVEDRLKNYEGYEYPVLTSRNHTCLLMFGTILQHNSEMSGGAVMQDITATSFEASQKSWIIDSENSRLLEYDLPSISTPKIYDLYMVLEGSAYTIYNGSLFTAVGQRKPSIVKYNLNTNSNERLNLNKLSVQTLNFLYKSGENYYDIMVDDNGIWAILPIPKSRNTAVLKFDPNSMDILHIWDVSLHHEKYDKMFIAAGILYTVTVEKNVIRILDGVDLYRNKYYNVDILIENPQIKVKEIQFNAKEFELNLWDDEKRWTSSLTCSKFEDFVITIPEE
ncbi:hypothetical protein FQA39_LY04724 [Lamprigera yunnana]|nr:hypothetical protein FQA39_LY04724 [Lamprigera yunnana]